MNNVEGALLALALSFALAAPAAAQSAGQWRSAEQIYGKVCARCHETHVAPRLLGRKLPAAYVRQIVLHGMRAMPAFRPTDFSEEELAALGRLVEQQPAPWTGRDHLPAKERAGSGAQP
jgi:mono/diheme cytochrome c family protein